MWYVHTIRKLLAGYGWTSVHDFVQNPANLGGVVDFWLLFVESETGEKVGFDSSREVERTKFLNSHQVVGAGLVYFKSKGASFWCFTAISELSLKFFTYVKQVTPVHKVINEAPDWDILIKMKWPDGHYKSFGALNMAFLYEGTSVFDRRPCSLLEAICDSPSSWVGDYFYLYDTTNYTKSYWGWSPASLDLYRVEFFSPVEAVRFLTKAKVLGGKSCREREIEY